MFGISPEAQWWVEAICCAALGWSLGVLLAHLLDAAAVVVWRELRRGVRQTTGP